MGDRLTNDDAGAGPAEAGGAGSARPGPAEAIERALAALRESLGGLLASIRRREAGIAKLLAVTEKINLGVGLAEVLEFLYEEIRSVIPLDRLGCALIDGKRGLVVARWARSNRPIHLERAFTAPLAGSSLEEIVRTGRPRIINDLREYLRRKPQSVSTDLIVREGMCSSLTCPLNVRGRPTGFLFFSSAEPGTYDDAHVEFFQEIAGQVAATIDRGRLYSELAERSAVIARQNEQMTHELDMARGLQEALVPAEPPTVPGLDVAFSYRPAVQIGGDVLHAAAIDGGRLVVLVGDAMGHGVPAALMMAAVAASFPGALVADDPAETLRRLNHAIQRMLGGNFVSFVTAACAVIDPAAGWADVALAGHGRPLLRRAATGKVTEWGSAGFPLGVQIDPPYETHRAGLHPGDTLVFCTDGLVEAMDPQTEQFGTARLRKHLRRSGGGTAAELVEIILADVADHRGGREPDDDVTLLVANVAAGG